MKKKRGQIYVGLFFLIAFACILPARSVQAEIVRQVTVSDVFLRDVTQEFFQLLNQERERLGLNPVQLDGSLTEAAEYRAAQAGLHFSHFTPTDTSAWELPFMKAVEGEILAYERVPGEPRANDVAKSLFQGWKNSSAHYSIMIGNFSYFGMGTAFSGSEIEGKNSYVYAIGLFGRKEGAPYTQGFARTEREICLEVLSEYLQFTKGDSLLLKPGTTRRIRPALANTGGGYSFLSSSCGTWESSHPLVADVRPDGRVTARAEGTAMLTFRLDGTPLMYQIEITVKEENCGWGEWNGKKVYYVSEYLLYSGWKEIDGKTYYFDPYMATGKTRIDGKVYYFHETEGYLLEDQTGSTPAPAKTPGTVVISVSSRTEKSIAIRWTKAAYADGYTVWVRAENEKTYKRKAILSGADARGYTLKNCTPGRNYYFIVKAWNKNNGRYTFGKASKTVAGMTKPARAVIKKITSNGAGNLKVYLKGKAQGATHYAICYSKSPDFKNYKIGIRTAQTTRTAAKGLKAGVYYVKVRSYRQMGNTRIYGDWSKAIKIRVG